MRPNLLPRRALLAALPLAAATRPSLAQSGPTAVVDRFHALLLEVMRDARRLGTRGRYDRLRPAMDAAFDLPAMARIAVGPPWARMTPEEQRGLASAFADWTIATYANRFNGFSGESFVTLGADTLGNGDQLVRTALNRVNDVPVALNYLLRRSPDGSPRIVDIYLSGTISELASRRAEFTALLREGGADRLIEELRRRTADLLRG